VLNPRPIAVVRTAASLAVFNQSGPRLLISLVVTGLDAAVLIRFGHLVYIALSATIFLRTAFVLLILGMIGSLARMWFLTVRNWRNH
jgi:hypothetical protein